MIAFREIEKANPDVLHGIFGNVAWTNKDKLRDACYNDLIEHFSTKTLTNMTVSQDVFGQAYEYLIKRFADQSNKKAGEYYPVTFLIVRAGDCSVARLGMTYCPCRSDDPGVLSPGRGGVGGPLIGTRPPRCSG